MLNNIASQLFLYLLQNGTKISTREEILLNVFQHNGSRATDANLNQHISSIRKAITAIDHSADLIVTTPRVGFHIDEKNIQFHLNQEVDTKDVSPPKLLSSVKRSRKNQRILIAATALFTLSTTAVVGALSYDAHRIPMDEVSILHTSKFEQCTIHILGNKKADRVSAEKAQAIFQQLVIKPDCSSEKDIYINIWQSNYKLLDLKFSAECGYLQGFYHCISKYQYIEN
ncbi:helix-turn-helix domain-containing protein [uncultured Pluralibacter sp.]|uniref:winged helix-turn-helix domain-containing protein n=1 Tax=uncultured Pluralibacter sp. TaxID=1490864 RepID=UPI0026300708|nr:helix-turn-helix domain-containing protein [uncultured Pluralibacter sp.]